jgi:hypothetical protein
VLRGEIHRHARAIHDECDRGRSRDKRFFGQVEAEHRGGTNAALIPDKASKSRRHETSDPSPYPLQFHAFGEPGYSGKTGKNEEGSEYIRENRTLRIRIQDSSTQPTNRARYSERHCERSIDVLAEPYKSKKRADEVGNGNNRHSDHGINLMKRPALERCRFQNH